jgi:L-alanine-DL-glutamate epimerase-like enolase superfamily enzyme
MYELNYRVGNHFNGFPTRSVELRGNSAADMALWDLAGKITGLPVHQLLGGLSRDKLRIYNTCAGYGYNAKVRSGRDSQLVTADQQASTIRDDRPYEDLEAQVHRPGELAESLLSEGITAMKIWPFDSYAAASGGHYISPADLKTGVGVVEQIRKTVSNNIDIMLEFHGLWHLPAALEIARALADYDIFWLEDPISMQNFDDLALYKRQVTGRVCGSENLGTLPWYREVLTRQAIDVVHFDMAWIGGISEGKKIAAFAGAFDRPIAPHDCTGPVLQTANTHLMMNAPNTLIAETVRAYYRGNYQDMVTVLPRIENGFIYPMNGAGLGTELHPDLLARDDVVIRTTTM